MTAKRQTKVSIWTAVPMDNKPALDIHHYNHIQYQQLPFDKKHLSHQLVDAALILSLGAGHSSILKIKVSASGAAVAEMLMLEDGWLPQGHGPVLASVDDALPRQSQHKARTLT